MLCVWRTGCCILLRILRICEMTTVLKFVSSSGDSSSLRRENEETDEEVANYCADISRHYVDAATAARNCNRK